jgi:hypothetical protein
VVDAGGGAAVVAPGLVNTRDMEEVDVLELGVGVAPDVIV